MTRLILARHGNTFRPEDTPVWVGARTDMPLVEKGVAQAQAIAEMLRDINIIPDVIITGPLQRTQQTAQIIAETLKLPTDKIRIDKRLTEIDYGAWEGKSTNDIIALGDSKKLAAWNKDSAFPVDAGWTPSETQIITDIRALLNEASHPTTLIITSNGILRFFAHTAQNAAAFPDRKVATGHICVMEHHEANWQITQWNQPPALLATRGV